MKSLSTSLALATLFTITLMSQTISSPAPVEAPRPLTMPGSPLGIAWFFLYGYSGVPAATYLPPLRELGAGFTKVYLFWQQIEPEKGRYDWTAVDAFVGQLKSPEEGLISIFSSSQWAAKRPSTMLPPSPARDLEDYYRFVFAMVSRCKGRVRYWQNDAEPNNPVFWSGTKEEFTAQLKVFNRAVHDADPAALVIVGGYDGLFIPPGMTPLPGQRVTPFPQQQAGLDFFEYVLREGGHDFDLFDLRLYGDPYTMRARVDYMRERMRVHGCDHPIICTEYGGPNFFEMPDNRQYISLISTWSQAVEQAAEPGQSSGDQHGANRIEQLYQKMATLSPQTQMFMQGCPADLEAKYFRLQGRSLVMRNVIGFAAGVQKMMYWDLLAAPAPRNDLMNLMYGKIGLLAPENDTLAKRTPTAGVYARMSAMLAGVRSITRVPVPEYPALFVYQVERGARGPLTVAWERRDAFTGEDTPATPCEWAWSGGPVSAVDAFGETIPVKVGAGRLSLPVSVTPIYIEPVR